MSKKQLWSIFSILILFLGTTIFFSSCDDDDEIELKQYTVSLSGIPNYSGITLNFTMFEYNDNNERIGTKHWNNAKSEEKKTFTAEEDAVKVKVYQEMETSTSSTKKWIQQVYYLKGNNTKIEITGESMIGSTEP